MAGSLRTKPSNLTQLAKTNEGKFPLLRIFQVIDGRAVVGSHGTRDMPIWGQRYTEDTGDTYGPYGGEAAVRARVLELAYYLQSLQQD